MVNASINKTNKGRATSEQCPRGGYIWLFNGDTQVPKDIELGSSSYDLDVGAVDTSPEMEWGEVNTEALFQAGQGPKEIFSRRGLVTFTGAKLLLTALALNLPGTLI